MALFNYCTLSLCLTERECVVKEKSQIVHVVRLTVELIYLSFFTLCWAERKMWGLCLEWIWLNGYRSLSLNMAHRMWCTSVGVLAVRHELLFSSLCAISHSAWRYITHPGEIIIAITRAASVRIARGPLFLAFWLLNTHAMFFFYRMCSPL